MAPVGRTEEVEAEDEVSLDPRGTDLWRRVAGRAEQVRKKNVLIEHVYPRAREIDVPAILVSVLIAMHIKELW